MMARDLARALDPAIIAADCDLTLDPWQADLMRSNASRVLWRLLKRLRSTNEEARHDGERVPAFGISFSHTSSN
jgi:hypothetical protein